MRTLLRNKTKVSYATFEGIVPILDDDGMETGESTSEYSEPVDVWMSVSANKGEASIEPFGTDLDYTKTVITDDMNCPITETSHLWIGISTTEPYNYSVAKVAKSLNHITYAVKEVSVS